MISELEVAGLKLHAGTRRRGFLRVGPYFDHLMPIRRYVLIPFTVVRGAKSGPTLVQIAGCHPTEYAGIDATVKLSNAIRPDELSGNFIGVPCVNIPGFLKRTYVNPLDEKNIQGRYPGRTDGTISDLIAYTVFNEIVLKANYYLDCHGGDIHESEIWSFMYYKTDDDVEEKSEAIAKSTGITYLYKTFYPGAMGMEAAKRRIAGGLYEVGTGDKLLPEESLAIFNATLNVMRYLGMLEGSPKPITGQPCTVEGQGQTIWTSRSSTYFTNSGLFHTNVKPGDLLIEGQEVGTVTDFWGEVIETIRAPSTGRVMLRTHNPAVNPGNEAATVYF
jgi:hypothetical protein